VTLDQAMRRIALYAGTALAVIGLTSVTIRASQKDIRDSIKDTHDDLQELRLDLHSRTVVDSVRFERIMGVVELAVTALVEPNGSAEQSNAVAELRRLRRIAP